MMTLRFGTDTDHFRVAAVPSGAVEP
jgi:hypothetical protein